MIGRHPGQSPLFLVSGDGAVEEQISTIKDSSDLHAELKRLLGPKCLRYAPSSADKRMEAVS